MHHNCLFLSLSLAGCYSECGILQKGISKAPDKRLGVPIPSVSMWVWLLHWTKDKGDSRKILSPEYFTFHSVGSAQILVFSFLIGIVSSEVLKGFVSCLFELWESQVTMVFSLPLPSPFFPLPSLHSFPPLSWCVCVCVCVCVCLSVCLSVCLCVYVVLPIDPFLCIVDIEKLSQWNSIRLHLAIPFFQFLTLSVSMRTKTALSYTL